jgi:hypothetical protein
VRHHPFNWTLSLASSSLNYNAESKCVFVVNEIQLRAENGEDYLLLEPFKTEIVLLSDQMVKVDLTPVTINLTHTVLTGAKELIDFLTANNKDEIISTCSKEGAAFIRQAKWAKCHLALKSDQLYCWDNETDSQLFNLKVTGTSKMKKGRLEVLQITDGKQIFLIAFKEEQHLIDWKT